MAIEQEVKLAFATLEAARQAVQTAGGRLVISRRLLSDTLFDTPDSSVRRHGATLRLRRDGSGGFLAWKGPQRPGPVKSREELETSVGNADIIEATLVALGYQRTFAAEKYREEFELGAAHVVIDDTPAGVFVEIESTPEGIAQVTTQLGKTTTDYRLESYATLWRAWCDAHEQPHGDMRFASTRAVNP